MTKHLPMIIEAIGIARNNPRQIKKPTEKKKNVP